MGGPAKAIVDVFKPKKPKMPEQPKPKDQVNESASQDQASGFAMDALARRRAAYGTLLTRGTNAMGKSIKMGGM